MYVVGKGERPRCAVGDSRGQFCSLGGLSAGLWREIATKKEVPVNRIRDGGVCKVGKSDGFWHVGHFLHAIVCTSYPSCRKLRESSGPCAPVSPVCRQSYCNNLQRSLSANLVEGPFL